ncbi:MAG TPA: sialidase family protein [Lacipirellulaceae bacterium]|nr:sialidase family protein [Lacipirellulaceae bacterium]
MVVAVALLGPWGGSARAGGSRALAEDGQGIVLDGFHFASIVRLKDGSLITERGLRSIDRGRSWRKSDAFRPAGSKGLLRLPNGELGAYEGDWSLQTAEGNDTNHWDFRWSADEGTSWSKPVRISLPGMTFGLENTMFVLKTGRLVLATYSQFMGSRFDKRGASWGTYQGVRLNVETEGHFPVLEAGRIYYSDDNGRQWKASDGWIIGWRDKKWSDSFTEPCGVELKDGRLLLLGRTLIGRIEQAKSNDGGRSWWPGAKTTELMSSYSPCCLGRLPTGDLVIVWNQLSRSDIRKGLRRCRLSSAISKDEGKSWEHFKNIEAIKSLGGISHVRPDDDLTPVWGDNEVGKLPDDFQLFHYPNLSIVDNNVFLCYQVTSYKLTVGKDGKKSVVPVSRSRTRILPVEWFYH